MVEKRIMFLDLEWDQPRKYMRGDEKFLEIGAVRLEGDKKTSFFTFVNPFQRTKRKTLNMLRADYHAGIERAPVLDVACRQLISFAKEPDLIVIWSDNSKFMYDKMCKVSGITFESPVLIFQDQLALDEYYGRKMSFEKLLLSFVKEFDPSKAHNARQDAICLCSLYCRFMEIKKSVTDSDRLERLLEINSNPEIERIDRIRRFRGKPVTDSDIFEISEFFHLQCKSIFGFYEIETGYSRWHMYMKGGYVKSLSHNRGSRKKHSGFHMHKLKRKDAYSVLDYISRHDAAFGGVPLYKRCE